MYNLKINSVALVNCLNLAALYVEKQSYIGSDDFCCGVHLSIKDGTVHTMSACNGHALLIYNQKTLIPLKELGEISGDRDGEQLKYISILFPSVRTLKDPNYKTFTKSASIINGDSFIYIDNLQLDEDTATPNQYRCLTGKGAMTFGVLPLTICNNKDGANYLKTRQLMERCLLTQNYTLADFKPVSIPGLQLGDTKFLKFLTSKTFLSDNFDGQINMYQNTEGDEKSVMFNTLTDAAGQKCFFANMPYNNDSRNNEQCKIEFSTFIDM